MSISGRTTQLPEPSVYVQLRVNIPLHVYSHPMDALEYLNIVADTSRLSQQQAQPMGEQGQGAVCPSDSGWHYVTEIAPLPLLRSSLFVSKARLSAGGFALPASGCLEDVFLGKSETVKLLRRLSLLCAVLVSAFCLF